jgi:chromosomal replication initiation ATPase DnaA
VSKPPRQLPLTLPARPALGRADFFVAPANALALAAVDDWRNWPEGKLALIGPEGSGKTHLAHVWAEAAGAAIVTAARLDQVDTAVLPMGSHLAVDDADRLALRDEAALLHLHNHVLSGGGRILFTARCAPLRWPVALPDLASRMQACATTALHAPDEALLSAVLVKLFDDRQVRVSPALISYLVSRMERSLAMAGRLVEMLDQRALARGGAITRTLAAEVLDNLAHGLQDLSSSRHVPE